MELEPLPKVTFLPAQLTELVIKNWSGDIIDFEKNGQVRFSAGLIFKILLDMQSLSWIRHM